MVHTHQVILIASTLSGSWLGMQAAHEAGHVAAAWATGGQVTRVVLHPLALSRTEFSSNPRPLAVAWAGALVGTSSPLVLLAVAALLHTPFAFLLRFFAGFCLIANGAYLAFGSFDGVGDAGDLLRHGSPPWLLWLFGALTVPTGLILWHGQGHHFGLGVPRGHVSAGATATSVVAFLFLTVAGIVVGA